jgi:Ni/Co efflux regulator RcnB
MKHRLMVPALVAALAIPSFGGVAFAQGRWDNSHNNGYYVGNTWHYGAPPAHIQRRHDYRPGWQNWRRGQRLPAYYRSHYAVVSDYRAHHLPPPRRGYHYVRDDTGNILLVAVATGLIASIIANQ